MEKTYGLRAVKLTEIPMKDRMSAARRASKAHAHTDEETCELIAAALCPSDRTYWVRAQAFGELPAAA